MNLQEIFDLLTFGELAQLSIGGGEAGVINDSNMAKVLPHINLGLISLYKRFKLKESDFLLQLIPGQYVYPLNIEDLIVVERVYAPTEIEISLNDPTDNTGCFTTAPKMFHIMPHILNTARYSELRIVYRANHPKLMAEDGYVDVDSLIIELPDTHIEPLLYFVASRLLASTGSGQFEGLASMQYLQKYEAACKQLTDWNPQFESSREVPRIIANGWV